MLLTIIWRGTFYDFRRTIERLHSWLRLHSKTFADADQQKLRDEILDMMALYPYGNPDDYRKLVKALLVIHPVDGKLVINHKAFVKVTGTSVFHSFTRACVFQVGEEIHLTVSRARKPPLSFERIVE